VYLGIRDIEISALIVSALSYLLCIYVVYRGTTVLFGERAAFFAAFFVTLSPVLVQLAGSTLTEPTFSALYLTSFFLYVRLATRGGHLWQFAALGLLLGFSYLIRPEAFLTGLLATISLAVLFRRQPRAFLPLLTFALVCAPYLFFLHANLDEWTLAGKASDPLIFYGEMYEGTPERLLIAQREADPEYFEQSLPEYLRLRGFDLLPRFRQNAGWIVVQMLGNLRHAALAVVLAIIFKAKVNVRRVMEHEHRLRIGMAFLIFLSPVPAYLLYFVPFRFMMPYSLLLLVLAGGLIHLLLPKAETGRNMALMYGIVGVSTLVLLSPLPLYRSIALDEILRPPIDANGSRAIGDWLHDNLDLHDKTIVGIGKLHVISFYASGRQPLINDYLELPAEVALFDIAPMMTAQDVDYLVLEGSYMRARPQLAPLWDDPASARTVGLLAVHIDPDEIFQIYRAN
jgi:4-amino-4-deoxy-L-arabinose transferase-like glycosyltransferase